MGLVFVALFAAYSLFRFREQMNPQWLLLSAVAIGFLPGIKSSGLPLAFFLIVATFWLLRGQHRLLAGWIIAATTSFCLLGSLEIYINNALFYGNPLGEPTFLGLHQNHDGVAGTVANTIRYVARLINPGSQPNALVPTWQVSLESACRKLLQTLELTNKGYGFHFSDQNMKFLKFGQEAGSDFGPLGAAAMIFSVLQVLTFQKKPTGLLDCVDRVGASACHCGHCRLDAMEHAFSYVAHDSFCHRLTDDVDATYHTKALGVCRHYHIYSVWRDCISIVLIQ